MRKLTTIVLLTAAMAVPALADSKIEGNTILKDWQPAGVADKHQKKSKHQVYDLTFDANGNEYICRTDADKSINVTNFVVGSSVNYEMDGKKVKIKTPQDKKVECKIVRVSLVSSSAVSTPQAGTPQQ
jgi:signal transduction histidine kinase